MILLAVDVSLHGKGIDSAFLKDASVCMAPIAGTIGARAVLVGAKDDSAKSFFECPNFEPSPGNPYRLPLIMKDLLRIVVT